MFWLRPAQRSGCARRFLLRFYFRAGAWGVLFPQLPQHFIERFLLPLLGIEWERAGQQLVEHHTQRVNVGTRVQVMNARIGLLRAHVSRRSDEATRLCEYSLAGRLRPDHFRQTEVNDPRRRFAIHFDHQYVGRLQVAVDDGLLVRVQHAIANFYEEFQTLADFQLMLVAVGGDRKALYVLHHKVRLAVGSGAGVEDFGDRWMVHDSEGLELGLKSLQHGLVVYPG